MALSFFVLSSCATLGGMRIVLVPASVFVSPILTPPPVLLLIERLRGLYGVGSVLGAQLIAEIGDVSRFSNKKALVGFAGIDAPPFQSGNFNPQSRNISKRGSAALRKTLFQVMSVILQKAPAKDPVFLFMDKKRSEGKHFYVYMMAGANKFLRIYYARVMEHLNSLQEAA